MSALTFARFLTREDGNWVFALSQRERVARDPDALHRDAGRAFARRRVMDTQGTQPATARRRVRGHSPPTIYYIPIQEEDHEGNSRS